MGRVKVMLWKDVWAKYKRRIRWFAENHTDIYTNMRICLEDLDVGMHNHYPKTKEEVQQLVADFKAGIIDIYGKKKV